MPTIKITDEASIDVSSVSIDENPLSGLVKYVTNDVIDLVFLPNLVNGLHRPIIEASATPLQLDLKFGSPLELGTTKPEITIDAGVSAAVHVAGPGSHLFADGRFGPALPIDPGVGYVSLALGGTVGVSVTADSGSLAFGVKTGGTVNVEFFRAFPVTADTPTVAEALGNVISHYTIPGDLEDLGAMRQGDVAVVSGRGSLTISASANLLTAVNPLASVDLPLSNTLSVKTGASIDVSASFAVSGEYQLRVRKLDESVVELGYYKKAGQQFQLDLTASAGVTATAGKFDLIQKLIGAVSQNPEADVEQLVNGGLTDDEIARIQAALAASLNRNVQASLELEFAALKSDEAAFLYHVDVATVDAGSAQAVKAALTGNLTLLNRMETAIRLDGTIGAGVRLVRSRLASLRKRSLSLKINLLGILNFASFSELVRRSEVLFEPTTGDLTISETVSGRRIGMVSEPFRADGEKLRKALFESLMFTSAYRVTAADAAAGFTCSQVHFAMNQDSSRQAFAGYLDGFLACGLLTAADRTAILNGITGGDSSTYLLRTEYDEAACEALFLDDHHQPLDRMHYEQVGRNALAALLQPGEGDDPGGLRRQTLLDPALWERLKDAGQPNFRSTLPPPRNQEPTLSVIIADYTLIEWWADAMSGAAKRLAAIRAFVATASPATLASSNEFAKLRDDLQRHFRNVISQSKASFGKPWGLTALYQCAQAKVAVTGVIVSRELTRMEHRDAAGASTRALRPGTRDVREARTLTGEEKETLRPFTIDLRMGALSTDGQFATSQEDLDRIFGEELPAELIRCKADGRKLQLLFYAHGGLVDELGGLLPILQRLPFWRKNGVYPIFFVWETGLKETIADIVTSLFSARALAIPQGVIEALARQGGLAVWSNMKRSAQLASLPTGGALAVAEKTRDFWKQNHADMQMHACGHSAGAIFHSFFLPALLGQKTDGAPKIEVQTLQYLAPACTTQLFEDSLLSLIGTNKSIKHLTMYTMHKDFELADKAGPYNASLLYLVSRAFETVQPTPLLGLEESVRKDSKLLRLFGLAGLQAGQADVLFSKTAPGSSLRSSTESTSHGDFDNDVKTMNSVVRRILDIPDSTSIFSFVLRAVASCFRRRLHLRRRLRWRRCHSLRRCRRPRPTVSAGGAASGGRQLALCIGIDNYPAPNQLGGCVNDARNWATTLTGLGFTVNMLENERATRAAILDSLRTMVEASRPGDVVVLQYAGHGTQVEDHNGDEDDGMDEALCPIDFASGAFLIDDDIRELFETIPGGVNVTCFMDCCHSGTITRVVSGISAGNLAAASTLKARFIPFRTALNQAHLDFRKRLGSRNVTRRGLTSGGPASMKEVLFSACLDREVAFESNGAGAFTFRATPLMGAGIDGLTNNAFKAKVMAAFGPSPQQTPGLDCSPASAERGFLRPIV